MRTLILGQVRDTIARVIGKCRNDQKVVDTANEAQERLLNRPEKPVGSMALYRICANEDCIVWPRPVRTIEAYALCSTPGRIVDNLFEFIGYPNGAGLLDGKSLGGHTLADRGTACAFDDVSASDASPRKIGLVATNGADAGKQVTLRYVDSNGQKKYSTIDGVVQEGERLTLPAPPAYVYTSSNVATNGLYHVVKDVTDYPVLMYEVDATTLIQTKQLSAYEPSETVPIYRRSYVPGLSSTDGCSGVDTTTCTENKQVTVLVKLQHVPVVVDNDPLVLGNLAAFKLMAMAIQREEQNRLDESVKFEAKARAELDGELSSYLGDGAETKLKVQSREIFGAGFPSLETAAYW